MGLPMLGATIMDDCDGTADVVLEERHRNLLYGYLDIPEQTLSAAVYCEPIIPLTSPPTERWTVAAGMAKLIIDRRYTLMCGLRIHDARDKS